MRDSTLGPPLESYGPNGRLLCYLASFALLACPLALLVAREIHDLTAWIVFWTLTSICSVLLLHIGVTRVWLHQDGISCRGLFGYRQMRWQELACIFFGSYEVWARYVSLGTFHRLRLVTIYGQSFSIGERIERADELAARIEQFTAKPLLQKAMQTFDSGAELDFGAIRLRRAEGLTVKKWFRARKIRWNEIEAYNVNSAYVRFERFKGFTWKIPSEDIANIRVLDTLLGGIMDQVWHHSRG